MYTCTQATDVDTDVASAFRFTLERFDQPSPKLKPEQVSILDLWHRHHITTPTDVVTSRRHVFKIKCMHIQCVPSAPFPSLAPGYVP